MYLMNDYPDVDLTIVWLVSLKNKQKLAYGSCFLINHFNKNKKKRKFYHVELKQKVQWK